MAPGIWGNPVKILTTKLWNTDLTGHMTKISGLARRQWLKPVILATQEAKIRRIAIWSQSWQIVHEILSQKYPIQKLLVEWLKAHVVQRLLSKCEALSSNPNSTKKEGKINFAERENCTLWVAISQNSKYPVSNKRPTLLHFWFITSLLFSMVIKRQIHKNYKCIYWIYKV
jgi:hypothetical protein